jgi:hypothetical protein
MRDKRDIAVSVIGYLLCVAVGIAVIAAVVTH